MLIVGVDPGKHGGIVTITPRQGYIVQNCIMPPPWEACRLFKRMATEFGLRDMHVFMERAQVMGKESARAMFTYGDHFGQLQGFLMAFGIPFTLVSPVTWTKVMHTGIDASLPAKKKSMLAFQRSAVNVTLIPPGCRVPHDGLVDAYLIAEWGRRHLNTSVAQAESENAA